MEAKGSGSGGSSSPLNDVPPPVNTGRAEGDQLNNSITEITNSAESKQEPKEDPKEQSNEESNESHPWIVPVLFLAFYAIIGITTHQLSCKPDTTCSLLDSIYFTVATVCTTGYGDIVPQSLLTKIFTIFLLLAGFGAIDAWLNGLIKSIFDWMESLLVKKKWITAEEGEVTTKAKMWVSLGIVALCMIIGTIAILCFEGLDFLDSFYLSVASVTTVGYGDFSFKTIGGRLFAILWLSLSTLAVSRALSCLSAYLPKLIQRLELWLISKCKSIWKKKEKFLDMVQTAKKKFLVKVKTIKARMLEMVKTAKVKLLQCCTTITTSARNSRNYR